MKGEIIMKMFRIDLEWSLHSGKFEFFGRSKLDIAATDIVNAINKAIRWCDNVPEKDRKENGFYMDPDDTTSINRIVRIFILGGK